MQKIFVYVKNSIYICTIILKQSNMKNLSKKQIEEVRELKSWKRTKFHGNKKFVGSISVDDYRTIVAKKTNREYGKLNFSKKTNVQLVRELINQSISTINTNYFKVMIEGSTGIYYASDIYGHSDYNKTRLFDKTPETMKLMTLFNSFFGRK